MRLRSKLPYSKIFLLVSILYVSPFAFKVSGADESLLTIVGHLPRDRYLPHVVVPRGSPYAYRFREIGATVHVLPILRLKRSLNPFFWFAYLLWLPVEVLMFRKLMKKNNIQLLHINMESTISAAIAAKQVHLPTVIHYRGNTSSTPKWFFDRFLPFLSRISNQIFVISQATARGFLDRGLKSNVEVLYNALSLERFSGPTDKQYFQKKIPNLKGKKVITYLGRIHPRKRIADLIQAAAILTEKLPDIAFAIVGGDMNISEEVRHKGELVKLINSFSSPPPVFFFPSEKRIEDVLSSSQLFVLPSLEEGFGRALIEAMACGVPVIASDSGAFPEILKNGTYGRLVPPCQPKVLAQEIMNVLNDPRTQDVAQKAKAYAIDHFNIEKHVSRLTKTYESLL